MTVPRKWWRAGHPSVFHAKTLSSHGELDNSGGVSMTHRAEEIRAGLNHPVIDGDGHWMEPIPVFLDYLAETGGPKFVDPMRAGWRRNDAWYRSTPEERQANRMRRFIWWGVTASTHDK